MKLKNAKEGPKILYGLHMVEGVAEYREPGKEPYRILISEKAIKNMDPTFAGKPIYVEHVDEVDLDNLQAEADGYVIESFFNKADGKHWTKFIVVSDDAHNAIRNGWKLSNAYIVKEKTRGGVWHGVDYKEEIVRGEYEHLAIVSNPRYTESVILTPEQFKEYNASKEIELTKLANSQTKKSETNNKGVTMGKFNLFKKEKIDNSADLEATSVVLPKSKKEVTVSEAIELADTLQNMNGYANGDYFVKVGDEEMSVNDLSEKYLQMCKKNSEEEEAKKANEAKEKEEAAKKENEGKEEEPKKENEDAEDDKKKENEDEEEKEDKKANEFLKLKNAEAEARKSTPISIGSDRTAVGKSRYGSK